MKRFLLANQANEAVSGISYYPVYGNSMSPKYNSGDIIGVRQIFNLDVLQWGESYLTVTDASMNNLKTVKNVHPCPGDESKIILRSQNDAYAGDISISKSSILSMHLVRGVFKIEHL